MSNRYQYSASDIGIVIPTKNRLQKIDNLLNSLLQQGLNYGAIVIVYIGQDITDIVNKYNKSLNIELYESTKAGQLVQRNYGISKLANSIKLVALFDDDIVLENRAFLSIIEFFNQNNCAGVSFNIVNHLPEKFSLIKFVLGLTARNPGTVLRSGLTTSNINVDKDISAQWLCGGATVWKKEILDNNKHKEIATKWAIAEDLIFSYPIGKLHPLYVCAKAQVRHEHVHDYVDTKHEIYHGYNQTIWLYYFVSQHNELSRVLFFYALILRLVGKLIQGLLKLNKSAIYFAYGQLKGLYVCFDTLIRKKKIENILNEN